MRVYSRYVTVNVHLQESHFIDFVIFGMLLHQLPPHNSHIKEIPLLTQVVYVNAYHNKDLSA
jgi:hypothetical protein